MPDPRYAQLLSVVLRCQINLQVAVFLGVRRQFVGTDVHLAPLEALADIPDRLQAGAPGREVIVLSLRLAEPLAADPVIGCLPVTIGAGEVELAELAAREFLAARDRRLRLRARRVHRDRRPIGE